MTRDTSAAPNEPAVRWRFFRAGGFDQVRLDDKTALVSLKELDQKLWAVLSCPTRGIEMDPKTLDLIDQDKDGRIRAYEIIAMVEWAAARLKDPSILFKRSDVLPLDAIEDSHDAGRGILAAARQVLAKCGKAGADSITLAEVLAVEESFSAKSFNGDGVVPPGIAEDEEVRSAITDIVATMGGVPDRSGADGVSEKTVNAFFAAAETYAAWAAREEADPALAPLGADSLAAEKTLRAVEAKLDDWFTRSALAAFDPRAADALNRPVEDWAALASQLLSPGQEGLSAFPLAKVAADASLPLGLGSNPAWAPALTAFRERVVTPILGERSSLSAEDWAAIKARFAARAAWRAEAPASPVATLGAVRITAILHSDVKNAILALIGKDLAQADEAAAIASVNRLLRFCRDLDALLNNFVAFRDFYTHSHKAVFQAGTLYLDGRSCDLCIKIGDPAAHAPLAALSRIYLVYCECTRRDGSSPEKIHIAAAVTAGDSDQLKVGRNGVFYDRQGQDWDAHVVRIVEHPISIRQSFWSPYKKLGRFISDQVEKFAAAKAAASQAKLAATVTAAPTAAAPPPFDVARFAGIFAAIGLAIGAIGTALASVVTGLLSLPWWQIPLAPIGLLLLISAPSMLIASFQLHQRNLGPILDANGWAVNTRARINIPFGSALTQMAKLPKGAERALHDPYAQRRTPWRSVLTLTAAAILLFVLWNTGALAALWRMIAG